MDYGVRVFISYDTNRDWFDTLNQEDDNLILLGDNKTCKVLGLIHYFMLVSVKLPNSRQRLYVQLVT